MLTYTQEAMENYPYFPSLHFADIIYN